MLGEELVDAESYLGSLFRVGPVEAMGTGSTVEYFVVELLSFGLESAYHMPTKKGLRKKTFSGGRRGSNPRPSEPPSDALTD